MQIAHESDVAWEDPPRHRGGVIRFKTLLEGVEGRPDNFQLLLADTETSFDSPRHRHTFDQFRFGIERRTNIGPRRDIEPGDLVYFPEGTHYGPQRQAEPDERSLSLVLQFGGPSGSGYMSRRQLAEGRRALDGAGTFEAGVFRRHAPAADGRRNQDSYEAIWEHVNGRSIEYGRPRYLEPVHMRSAGFAWRPVDEAPGVSDKHLGSFAETGAGARLVRLEAGAAWRLPDSPANARVVFFVRGSGRIDERGAWRPRTAVHLDAGEGATLRAGDETEALVLSLNRA